MLNNYYVLEMETNVCINIKWFEKNRKGLKEAFLRAESFLLFHPDAKASILENSTQELVWSSSGANPPKIG